MTRHDVEVKLRGVMEEARAEHDRLLREMQVLNDLAYAASGTPDGTLASVQASRVCKQYREARELYMAALKAFSDFVITRWLPADQA